MGVFLKSILACVLVVFALSAQAQERGNADEAKALVGKALEHVKAVGMDKAMKDFTENTDGKWRNKDLYLFANNFAGLMLAHGTNKALVGQDTIALKDGSGKEFVKEMVGVAKDKGTGTVDYTFTDPVTKKLVPKVGYVARVPGQEALVGVGVVKQ
jgi:signal transduction histidine kinase